jgi:wyosine [tRNA(Phe)-imidazoG37] synthetase (radical SAM superfamily)
MSVKRFSHAFGPVPSRRLGRSLGVDLTPFKTCTLDCIYCQLGPTTRRTLKRREFFPPGEIVDDVREALASGPPPDHVTLAGSGEPTLYQPLDEIIRALKKLTTAPVVVLTNGSLLADPQVRAEIAAADILMPSLDAASENLYQQINRPHPELNTEGLLAGLSAARREFAGQYWLEVMLLEGINTGPEALTELGEVLATLQPDEVHLNTVVRPPAESWVQALSPARRQACAAILGHRCKVIADEGPAAGEAAREGHRERVLALIERRPCRLDDLASGLQMHRNMITKYLGQLLRAGAISSEQRGDELYYRAAVKPSARP